MRLAFRVLGQTRTSWESEIDNIDVCMYLAWGSRAPRTSPCCLPIEFVLALALSAPPTSTQVALRCSDEPHARLGLPLPLISCGINQWCKSLLWPACWVWFTKNESVTIWGPQTLRDGVLQLAPSNWGKKLLLRASPSTAVSSFRDSSPVLLSSTFCRASSWRWVTHTDLPLPETWRDNLPPFEAVNHP